MTGANWRIIVDGVGEPAWNMALDEALLEGAEANTAPPTLRLYQWSDPSVSLGRFQNIARTLNSDRPPDVALVRRITGGRGILHGDDLTVSISTPIHVLMDVPEKASIASIYATTAKIFLKAFQILGICAVLGECQRGNEDGVVGDCFATVSRADIVECETGRKLLGAAIHRRGDTILQQVTIPLNTSEKCLKIFRGSKEQISVPKLLVANLKDAILEGITDCYPAEISRPSETEMARARTLVSARYNKPEWNETGRL